MLNEKSAFTKVNIHKKRTKKKKKYIIIDEKKEEDLSYSAQTFALPSFFLKKKILQIPDLNKFLTLLYDASSSGRNGSDRCCECGSGRGGCLPCLHYSCL